MPESLTTILGFDAAQALQTLKSLEISLAGYTTAMRKAASATRAYNKAAQGVDTQLAKQSNAIKGFATAQDKSSTAIKKGSKALNNIGKQTESVSTQTNKLAQVTKKSGTQMILTWQSVIRIFTIQVIHQMISKIVSSLGEATEEARKFEIGIAEVETIASSVGLSFNKLANQAREAAVAIGQPLGVAVEAQYQLYSNQVGNATESLMAFEAAQKLSLAAVTPLNDAVALVTGTLNAYGKSAAEAKDIAAKLFKTVELGRVRINEMGDTLGRVTVLGAELGISLEAILASIATLTIQGVKASDAMTQILNVELKLIRPTDALKDAMAELGLMSAEAGIQAYGFQGFLQALRDTTDGTATAMGELFGRVRATRGGLGITGKAASKYAKNLEEIKKATAELLEEKLELIFRTNAKQVEIELNKLNIQITENFGRGMNRILKETFDIFGGATTIITTLTVAASAAGVTFLLLRAGYIKTTAALFGYTTTTNLATGATIRLKVASLGTVGVLTKLRIATLAFLATPMGAAIAMAAAILVIAAAYKKAEAAAKKYFEEVRLHDELTLKQVLKNLNKEHKVKVDILKEVTSDYQKHLTGIIKLETEAANKAKIIEERLHESVTTQIQARISAIKNYHESVIGIIDDLSSKLKKLRDDSRDIKTTIEAFKFERKTKGMDDIEKFYANTKKSQDLRYKAQSAIRNGEVELGKLLNTQALQYASQALASADAAKSSSVIRRAEENKINILEDQLDFNRQISRQEQVRASRAEKSASGLFEQVSVLKSLYDQYQNIDKELTNISLTDKERITIVDKQLELIGKMESEYGKFAKRLSEAKALDLEEPFEQAIKAFREPLTGIEMDLSSIVQFNAGIIAETLQVSLDEASKKVKLKVLEITGEKATAKQVTELTKLNQQYTEEESRLGDIAEAQHTVNTLWNKTAELTIAATKELAKQDTFYTKIQRTEQVARKAVTGIIPFFPEPKMMDVGYDPLIRQIQTLAITINNMIQEGANIDEVNKKLIELRQMELSATSAGLISVANAIDPLASALEKGRDAMETLQDASEFSPTSGIQALNSIGNAAITNKDKVRQLADALRALEGTIPSVSRPGSKSLGGMIYRQYGGFTPKGTDTIPAMLSPGEFVVNAKSTKRFFSQLIAINSGIKPAYRQAGGPVTNVGDVNINVAGAPTPQQTARETMAAFRRETRRQTSK